jgi:hypothetical protein
MGAIGSRVIGSTPTPTVSRIARLKFGAKPIEAVEPFALDDPRGRWGRHWLSQNLAPTNQRD